MRTIAPVQLVFLLKNIALAEGRARVGHLHMVSSPAFTLTTEGLMISLHLHARDTHNLLTSTLYQLQANDTKVVTSTQETKEGEINLLTSLYPCLNHSLFYEVVTKNNQELQMRKRSNTFSFYSITNSCKRSTRLSTILSISSFALSILCLAIGVCSYCSYTREHITAK